MTLTYSRSHIFALGLACSCIAGCAETPTAQRKNATPSMPLPRVTVVRGEVDADRGTLTFSPVPMGGSGFTPAVYGDQGGTVRLSNTPVVVTQPSSTVRRFEAQVGIRNLLAHVVGDEQAGASPPDTVGIFVFFISGPIVTAPSPCTGCAVTLVSHLGTATFTAPNQKYFHWQERLAPAGSLTGEDTTRQRATWRFDADAAVTGFQFDVLISAAWPPPHETRWKVEYSADSLPETGSEPRWRLRDAAISGARSASGGFLEIDAGAIPGAETSFYRRDSLAAGGNAYIEMRLRYNGGSVTQAGPWLLFDDGTKFIAFGVRSDQVGFIDASRNFLGTPFAMNTRNAHHTYQLRKYAADSAVFYVNGTRRGWIAYASLAATAYPTGAPLVQFGHVTVVPSARSNWDYVIYELGAASP